MSVNKSTVTQLSLGVDTLKLSLLVTHLACPRRR